MSFQFYRILCATPAALEAERQVFEAAIGRFNEEVAMKDGVLFAPASFRPDFHPERAIALVEANIRLCEFFIQILDEQAPQPAFVGFLDYALERVAGVRKAAVLFRNAGPVSQEAAACRQELAARGCEIREFQDKDALASILAGLFLRWYGARSSGA